MASLGYAPDYDRDAAMELYPFLADVPADNYIDAGGYELYLIVPCQNIAATVYAADLDWVPSCRRQSSQPAPISKS